MAVHYRLFEPELSYLNNIPNLEALLHSHFVELPMLAALFAELHKWSEFENYHWLIVSCHHDIKLIQTPLDPDCIVIYLSNEDGLLPPFVDQVKAVFTPYSRFWPLPQNVYLIPLACNGDLPEVPWIPFAERTLDVFFSGQAIPQRGPFIREVIELLAALHSGSQFQAQITLSSQFRGGLSPEIYAQCLMNSKIALLPPGFSPITFRFFEAMRAGCLMVSTPMPPFWYLQGLPLLQMPLQWQNLSHKIMGLLQDRDYQLEIHQRTCEHYHNHLSAPAVASYIQRQLIDPHPGYPN